MNGGWRRWRVLGGSALALLPGCTVAVIAAPRPCDLLDDRPGLREELRQLRAMPGDPFQATRWYVLDSDESCTGNRALGAPPIHRKPVIPFWKRWWGA